MWKDLVWAGRCLGKRPLFAVAVVGILTLGIGANTAVFSVVDAVLLRPLPYPSAERLVRIEETSTRRASVGTPSSDFLRWRDRRDLFETILAFRRDLVTVTGAGEPDQIWALRTSAGLFPMLGVHAQQGRTLVEADNDPGAPNTAVLSDRLWKRVFHGDRQAIGRTLTLSNEIFTIVGVMPPGFEFSNPAVEIWVPLRLAPASSQNVEVIARTRAGLPVSRVQSAMAIIARQLEREAPVKQAGLRIVVSPWREIVQREYELTLILVLAAVGLVLMIACADVASLLLSRAVQRQKEIAIRASLGAGLWRVLRQLLAESFVVTFIGTLAGVGAVWVVLQLLSKQMAALPVTLPHLQQVAINGRVLLFSAALCLLISVLCSLAPVLLSSQSDLQATLRGGRFLGGSKGPTRLFSILIGCETAFAVILLVGSGLLGRSLIRLQQSDHGIHPDHVLTMRVPIGTATQPRPTGKYDSKPRQMAYYHELVESLRAVRGVAAVAVVNNLPLSNANTTVFLKGPDGQPMQTATRTISPEYFAVMGIQRLAGRSFSEADGADAPHVAIINESLARLLFPDRNPLGQSLSSPEGGPTSTVVGLVRDSPQMSYDQVPKGELYLPYQQTMFGVFLSTIVVRTSGDPLVLADALRKQIWTVDPEQPVVKVETMNDIIADSIWRPRFSAWAFSLLGGLALLLTFAGVYAVVAYTSALRVREVGIRIALGASAPRVVRVIMRSAMIPLVIGLAIGIATALFLSRLLASLLYETRASEPTTYFAAAILLLAIGAIASAGPSWRAATGDPLEALRAE